MEEELIDIEALKKGDARTYQKLVKLFSKRVYNSSFYILQNKEEAEDITQDVFMTVYQSIHFFKGDAKLSTWIYRITINKCQEYIRFKTRKKRFGFNLSLDNVFNLGTKESPEHLLLKAEESRLLFEAIEKLPEKQRVAYTLFNMEEHSYQEIAEIMEMSHSAIESLIFRAKQNLRKNLSNYNN